MCTAAILQRDNITVKNTHKIDNNLTRTFNSEFVRHESLYVLIFDNDCHQLSILALRLRRADSVEHSLFVLAWTFNVNSSRDVSPSTNFWNFWAALGRTETVGSPLTILREKRQTQIKKFRPTNSKTVHRYK